MILGSNLDEGKGFITSLKRPDQLCGTHSLLFSGYYSESLPEFSEEGESLTISLHQKQGKL
jgi:hypothetical protein